MKPEWIRVRIGSSEAFSETRARLRAHQLHTVCEEAACPNLGHCWSHGRATIMILGDRCTRGCRFCNVTKRKVLPPDTSEPQRVAQAVKETGLREVVLTSVTRDDLPDGGAAQWAATIAAVHAAVPRILVEVLIPDFGGSAAALELVMRERPAILGHNLETVPRLYPQARPEANYARSLELLRRAAQAQMVVKTSLMLGLGELRDEVSQVMREAHAAGVSIFYAGQYLQPSREHLAVVRYLPPQEFAAIGAEARSIGFSFVAAAPLVRSSYFEEEQWLFQRQKGQL